MKILLPLWGSKHLELTERALFKSLSWPKNREAIKDAEWLIVTDSVYIQQKLPLLITEHKLTFYMDDSISKPGTNVSQVLLKPLLWALEKCVAEKEPLLMATPDYIYGDGTIGNLKAIAGENGVASFAHMRVLPKILDNLENPLSNAELIGLGLKHQHLTWANSQDSLSFGMTFYGGIFWQELTNGLLAVRHFLPAPFLASVNQSDIDFFKAKHDHPHNGTFALWDHLWPTKLISENRLRLAGSSDIATMIEVTEADKNLPPANPLGFRNEAGYCNHWLHNDIQGQFVTCFRGEG